MKNKRQSNNAPLDEHDFLSAVVILCGGDFWCYDTCTGRAYVGKGKEMELSFINAPHDFSPELVYQKKEVLYDLPPKVLSQDALQMLNLLLDVPTAESEIGTPIRGDITKGRILKYFRKRWHSYNRARLAFAELSIFLRLYGVV